MKLVIAIAVVVIAIALVGLLARKSVHAELFIDAKPTEVWKALMDKDSYGQWNPIFTAVEGTFAEQATMQLSMTTSDGSSTQVEVLVEELVPNEKLKQKAGIPLVLTAEHQWLLEAAAEGTKVVQHEEYRGVGVLFWNPSYVQVLYEEGLGRLKLRLEQKEQQ